MNYLCSLLKVVGNKMPGVGDCPGILFRRLEQLPCKLRYALKSWKCITSGVQCTSNNFYVLAFTFEYTASNSALSSRMAATSLAKSPPSLMKFFRSSNPVFPFLEVVLCRSSPLDLLLGIKLIFDITFLDLTNSPPSLVSVSLEF